MFASLLKAWVLRYHQVGLLEQIVAAILCDCMICGEMC